VDDKVPSSNAGVCAAQPLGDTMNTTRSRIRELAWVAPGVILLGLAAVLWSSDVGCDSGGCAVGLAMSTVALVVVWPIAALTCSKVAAWLSEKRRLSLFTFVAAVGAAGSFPCLPFVAVCLWRQFFVAEALFLWAFAFSTSAVIALLWWVFRVGFALAPASTALSPNTSLERTRER
jgi:hypothetical protein